MRRRGALFLLALLAPAPARAQLFSPGKLARPHAALEGITSCTKCHPAGEQLSAELCLDCHRELQPRLKEGRGYHGRLPEGERACERCHHEHQGLEAPLVQWEPQRFDHAQTGYRLEGGHAKLECERCHDPRLISDPAARKLAVKPGKERTYLGLPTRCARCHFDEHRGQEDQDCSDCHQPRAWKPAQGFRHDQTQFALLGAHAKVECAKCHRREVDETTPADAFPAPRAPQFTRYRPVAHTACTDCHQDPHAGRFGADCASCHSEEGWLRVKKGVTATPSFHDRTRYPLQGQHRKVGCNACHLPLGKERLVYRGLPFARCADCHLEAHRDQLPASCEDCHDVEGFSPARYGAVQHARTRFTLDGAHLAVGCPRCHPPAKEPPAVDAALERALKKRGRAPRASATVFALPGKSACASCHQDVHRGQLAERVARDGCEGCHQTSAFSELRFDHQRDTRWPLTGRHARAACGRCHRGGKGEAAVRYRPIETACRTCHQDEHAGQLQGGCERCHATERFAPSSFDLAAHQATRFPLDATHGKVPCARCHARYAVQGRELTRYSGVPRTCAGCHADFHQGAFADLEPAGPGRPPARPEGSPRAALAPAAPGCERCHPSGAWLPAKFEHQETGYPLNGAHAGAPCRGCHPASYTAIARECAGCHRDPHGGELGRRCAGCHEEASWLSRFDADAHRRTAFPLSGAHAVLPCEECHLDAPVRGFFRSGVACTRCHLADYQRAALSSIDHQAAGFDTACQRCHTPWRFSRAAFPGHDTCFSIGSAHAGVGCKSCHTSLLGARADGSCATHTAACTGCHEHTCDSTDGRHDDVPGYQCKDRKCYECHRFAVR